MDTFTLFVPTWCHFGCLSNPASKHRYSTPGDTKDLSQKGKGPSSRLKPLLTGGSAGGRLSLHLTGSHQLPHGLINMSQITTAIPAACWAGGPVHQQQIRQELGMWLGTFNWVTHTGEGEKELRAHGRRFNCICPEIPPLWHYQLIAPEQTRKVENEVQTILSRFALFNVFFIYIKMIQRDWQHRTDSKSRCRLAL